MFCVYDRPDHPFQQPVREQKVYNVRIIMCVLNDRELCENDVTYATVLPFLP